jgi:hypothetical protein
MEAPARRQLLGQFWIEPEWRASSESKGHTYRQSLGWTPKDSEFPLLLGLNRTKQW